MSTSVSVRPSGLRGPKEKSSREELALLEVEFRLFGSGSREDRREGREGEGRGEERGAHFVDVEIGESRSTVVKRRERRGEVRAVKVSLQRQARAASTRPSEGKSSLCHRVSPFLTLRTFYEPLGMPRSGPCRRSKTSTVP